MLQGPWFFIALALASGAVLVLPGPRSRRWAVSLSSCALLAYLSPSVLGVAVALTLGTVGVVRRRRDGGSGTAPALMSAALIAALVAHKIWRPDAQAGGGAAVFDAATIALPFGFSYLVFRLVHHLIESRQPSHPAYAPGSVITYTTFFPVFFAGPIDRIERLVPQFMEWPRPSRADLACGVQRILEGLFKKLLLADGLAALTAPVLADPWGHAAAVRWGVLLLTSFRIYMDFAGYSDIAIGASRLLGIRVMENFDNPYLKPNIGQFWRSWHISLSDWIRDYVFHPCSRLGSGIAWTMIAATVSMIVFGLWHGLDLNFALWGAYQGAGICVFQWFQNLKRRSPALRRAAAGPWFRYASVALTFSFVTYGWTFFLAGLGTPLPLWGGP